MTLSLTTDLVQSILQVSFEIFLNLFVTVLIPYLFFFIARAGNYLLDVIRTRLSQQQLELIRRIVITQIRAVEQSKKNGDIDNNSKKLLQEAVHRVQLVMLKYNIKFDEAQVVNEIEAAIAEGLHRVKNDLVISEDTLTEISIPLSSPVIVQPQG